jgi:hypothetical protein
MSGLFSTRTIKQMYVDKTRYLDYVAANTTPNRIHKFCDYRQTALKQNVGLKEPDSRETPQDTRQLLTNRPI